METISKPLLILGAGGHTRVLLDCLKNYKCTIIGLTDSSVDKHASEQLGVKVIGNDHEVLKFAPGDILLVNGLGSVGIIAKRKELFKYFKTNGYYFAQVIHPSAVIGSQVETGEGVQLMAGAIIQPGCFIDDNVLINTKVSVDHDCEIGKNVHVAPGVTLSGNVRIEDDVHLGSGTTIIQGIRVGMGSIIGAGSLVLDNIPPYVKAMGVPAKVVSP